jgi:hypothetical protein
VEEKFWRKNRGMLALSDPRGSRESLHAVEELERTIAGQSKLAGRRAITRAEYRVTALTSTP